MGFRTVLWAGFFFGACAFALMNPIWGIVGYMGHYMVGPERQWWAGPINSLALRYSLTLSICTLIGILLTRLKVSFNGGLLHTQQKLILGFLAVVWFTTLITQDTVGRYNVIDHPSIKLTKIVIFTFMLCHVASNMKDLGRVIGILVIGTFVLGQKAYELPRSSFIGGRLDTVGGADFAESNFLAAFLVGVLPIIGVQFLRTRGLTRIVCLISGVFAANALVLARSRGAFIALGMTALVALVYAPKHFRRNIYLGLFFALAGGWYLADEQFIGRMTTIAVETEDLDRSASRRLEAWKGGLEMFQSNPLGIGTGNWYQEIGKYSSSISGLDSHSTYVKLAAEQGVLGIISFASIVLYAFWTLQRVRRRSADLPPEELKDFQLLSLGFTLSLTGFLLCCGLITLLYMEALWWFLVLPVCLERSLDRVKQQLDYEDLEFEEPPLSSEPDAPTDPESVQQAVG